MEIIHVPEKASDVDARNLIEMQGITENGDRSAESIASTETNDKSQVQWSELPFPALEKIYSLLYVRDQVNMSLVCHKWSKGYSSPSVWKDFHFLMNESEVLMDSCYVMRFARKYGNMFRRVDITCIGSDNKQTLQSWCKHFISFMNILKSNSQVISIKFRNLLLCFEYLGNPMCFDICTTIANFLESHHLLKRVEFQNCFFSFGVGSVLLRELTDNNRESLKHLVLRGFDRDGLVVKEPSVLGSLPTLVGLPSLTTLEIDYSFIFENLFSRQSDAIQTLKNCKTPGFFNLTLHYEDDTMDRFRGLTSSDWRFLKKVYPGLQVEFNFKSDSPTLKETEFFIMQNMPITSLTYKNGKFNLGLRESSTMEIDELLNHLLVCKTNDHLVFLDIRWILPIPDLASIFIPFLQVCKKLKCLVLYIVYPASGLFPLMQSWLEKRPESLEKIKLEISGLEPRKDAFEFLEKIETFKTPFAKSGLNFEIDYIFSRRRNFF